MGYVMRLCCGSRYFWLVFVLFSGYSFSAPSCNSWSTIPKNSNPQKSSNAIKTSCKLMSYGSGYKTCGDSSKEVNFQTIDSDDTGLTVHHGLYEPHFF